MKRNIQQKYVIEIDEKKYVVNNIIAKHTYNKGSQ